MAKADPLTTFTGTITADGVEAELDPNAVEIGLSLDQICEIDETDRAAIEAVDWDFRIPGSGYKTGPNSPFDEMKGL